jgi:hypothetical protein
METNCQTLSCIDTKATCPGRFLSKRVAGIAIALLIAAGAIIGELKLIERAPVTTQADSSSPATDIARVLDHVFEDGESTSPVIY